MARRDIRKSATPLLDWGEQLRATKRKRRRIHRRVAITGAGSALFAMTVAFPPTPRLVWNASASAPIGLYAVSPGAPIDPGDMVIARVPDSWRIIAAQRRDIPANVPLVKQVAAVAGDEVCGLGPVIFVNGVELLQRRAADAKGRPLPWWNGCIRLRGRQLFLAMPNNSASFDGRYFGVTEGDHVVGKARLLWPSPTRVSGNE
jgi:conjugative transfer signal peptidase TraF